MGLAISDIADMEMVPYPPGSGLALGLPGRDPWEGARFRSVARSPAIGARLASFLMVARSATSRAPSPSLAPVGRPAETPPRTAGGPKVPTLVRVSWVGTYLDGRTQGYFRVQDSLAGAGGHTIGERTPVCEIDLRNEQPANLVAELFSCSFM